MPEAVVFDVPALLKLSFCEIEEQWFCDFTLPPVDGIMRGEIGATLYLLREASVSDGGPLVVINLSSDEAVLRTDSLSKYIFERIGTIARSIYTTNVTIPLNWHVHREGSLASVYAASKSIGGGVRINFDAHPAGTEDLFVFSRTEESVDFDLLRRYDDLYLKARANYSEAIAKTRTKNREKFGTGITLREKIAGGCTTGTSLSDWYKVKFTDEQRRLIDMPHNGPVRVRGAAGTGKTLALVVKFLHDGCRFEKEQKSARFCFLTHSSGTVSSVTTLCSILDPLGLTLGYGKSVQLQIRTLYDLAFEYLRFDTDQLKPLSLDGREGRILQTELVHGILSAMWSNKLAVARYSDVSPHISDGWARHSERDNRFVPAVLNEFASVLDADGVWANTEKGEKYARGTLGYRPVYLMDLPTEVDRRFILEIHRLYRKELSDMKALSVDQMVADFNSFLNGNTWDRLNSSKGFDAVFVDELHLFSAIEREILHKLIRSWGDESISVSRGEEKPPRPPIFMAYDVKQAPRDSFVQLGDKDAALFSPSSQLQQSDLIKLSKVFRYTPQIADFLYDLDAAFPAINMAGEWEELAAESQVQVGEKPTLSLFKTQAALVRDILKAAADDAKRRGGRKVAVLCVNESLYDQYVKIAMGRYPNNFIEIGSRDASPDLRHSGKKAVLSMPEFVAGLQFEVVYLIHVDSQDFPMEMNPGEKRRAISTVYLGASRAELILKLVACEERGGPAQYLDMALQRQSIVSREALDVL
ncbi:hypothetical protein G6321_00053425 [Bradyrhizobium barranii subsp. barranii]|uniref:UvrD-like helicase ATP-binding domain-containing protein n=1 Tax=Bradyrhizobium barranii subsp. barranii TaxID=2823807 RepID=A0A7Z0Q9Y7_9BRAD|nr:hypothetical protein [Bradyrhizobium barranii]UGX94253.1 hypothetical protein G6321_00053425 [Bradyrhizobium barranii subsp. barranii]